MVSTRDTIRIVQRMTRELRGRVRGIVRRASLGTLTGSGQLQTLQAKTVADDVDDGVELFEQHGFTSGPPAGSEGLVLRVGGERGHSVGLAFHSRSTRPAGVLQGEVCVYHESGAHVTLRNDGTIEVEAGPGQVVKLGGTAAELAVARATDPVHAEPLMVTWMSQVVAAIGQMAALFNAAGAPMVSAPGSVTPVSPPTVAEPFARINAGGVGSEST